MIKNIVTFTTLATLVLSVHSWKPWQRDGSAGRTMLVVDTDAGADDAMAISLILNGTRHTSIQIMGITCVRGNTGVHNVSRNVLRTLKVNGRLEIPVFEGSDYGLIAARPTDDYFGDDGLGDFDYPVPNVSLSQVPAAVFLANLVRKNPGAVTIVALGPLTNLAVAGLIYPGFYENAKDIIVLGGSTSGKGNMDGVEFNVWADTPAAEAVFSRSPAGSHPITIIPMETISQLNYPWLWRKYVLGLKRTAVMDFLNLAERKEPEDPAGWQVADQVAASVVVDPSIVLSSFVGRSHLMSNGTMTVTKDGHNVRVVSAIDKNQLKRMLQTFL